MWERLKCWWSDCDLHELFSRNELTLQGFQKLAMARYEVKILGTLFFFLSCNACIGLGIYLG